MKDVLEPIIGAYEPYAYTVTQSVIIYDNIGNVTGREEITRNEYMPDFGWFVAAVVVVITLYSVFRIVGSLIGGKR